jgi:hypothetical protein
MSEKPCDKQKKEMIKAREDWDAATLRRGVPPSHEPLDPNKDIKPKIMTPELLESIKQAKESAPELEKIYLEKLEAYNNCKKANKKSRQ